LTGKTVIDIDSWRVVSDNQVDFGFTVHRAQIVFGGAWLVVGG
jgi:hypothetical protein